VKKVKAQTRTAKLKSRTVISRLIFVGAGFVALFWLSGLLHNAASANDERKVAVENALYTKAEFFGAQSSVPFPTVEARNRLAEVAENFADDAEIIQKLAELDEKLARFDSAEQNLLKLIELQKDNLTAHENLADFYNRRAQFEKSAAVLDKMLAFAPTEKRDLIFGKLVEFARIHELESYQNDAFYQKIVKENPSAFKVIETLIDTLESQEKYAEALKLLSESKKQFPDRRDVFLKKEVDLLISLKSFTEAEKVYLDNFDPFWEQEISENFYRFLDSQNRLRAYGKELKDTFNRNPTDFKIAVRLSQYQQNDGIYGNDSSLEIINKLEESRTAANIEWSAAELSAAARILLAENETDAASRFLYTLNLKGGFASKSEIRAQVLYELFQLFSNAENEPIALSKGDLQFYKDVAAADNNPGITTGILSLIFADSHPQNRIDEKERDAAKLFNHTAAYRIFLEFKEEKSDAPELAQMYLDIVRSYAARNETEIAEKTLVEFEQKYESSSDYPDAALKLADAFSAVKKDEKEREIYRKLLVYLGKQGEFTAQSAISSESDEPQKYRGFLSQKKPEITYQIVLKRLVDALAKEKKTDQILAVYSNEIAAYPNQEWLYEQRLQWLGQTNLAEEELKVYRAALEKFPTRNWQDKLARWFLRQNRQQEFAEYSKNLVEKLNDAETEKYLSEFISPSDFDDQLYLSLYKKAHERFPHNLRFINGLLSYYEKYKLRDDWRKLAAQHYFEFAEVRELYIRDLASHGELRNALQQARNALSDEEMTLEKLPYALFRADSSAHLSGFEEAVGAYQKLNELYPNTPEFEERLINFTRSFGQNNREILQQTANLAHLQAENLPSSAEHRTRSGELQAELGDYQKSNEEWRKLIETAKGTSEIYLETATVEWDYFQYDEALQTIKNLREKTRDESLYAFQIGAILEAKHDLPQAISEYLKTLGIESDEDYSDSERAKNRLVKLSRRKGVAAQIDVAFKREKQRRKDDLPLALGYAEYLSKIDKSGEAKNVLRSAIPDSRNTNDLENAEYFLSNKSDFDGAAIALKRLADVAQNPKDAISYRLQLAESFAAENRRDEAKNVLSELLAKFPTNYGVLTETAEIFWQMNLRDDAIRVLQTGVMRGKGEYKYIFSRKLAAKLVVQNRLPEAETILFNLHETDKSNTEVFRDLANIYVRTGNAEQLRKNFAETVAAVKSQDIETEAKRTQVAEFRRRMIEAFTQLKDYKSAVEQHIEIINREPDEAANVQTAIDYVKRYGGAKILLEYYQKTAAEAYKNYRWNIVLAQLYEADGDAENAAQNYKLAIANQPEMTEFYVALAHLESKRNNFDFALENVNKVLELTNEAQLYIRLKIEILEKAGRKTEADEERKKLPVEQRPKLTISEQFSAARNSNETEKAVENYRQAFDALLENPYSHDLRAADVNGYVQTLRSEENLNQIAEKLWLLREKFIAEAETKNSTKAGEARKQLQILDGAMPEAIGNAAKNFASSEENKDLQKDLERRIDAHFGESDQYTTLSLLQNIAFRAGFGALAEKILNKQLEDARSTEIYFSNLKSLVDFYNERAMYRKTAEILERERENFGENRELLKMTAENSRILGDTEKEITVLREIYNQADKKLTNRTDESAARYFEILYKNGEPGKSELTELSKQSSPHQFQLINFLLAKGENLLAHQAIENVPLQKSWKLARNAETSLNLREYGVKTECYFCDALKIAPIGELVEQESDEENKLIGDDWFRLSREYGEWLLNAPDVNLRADAKKYLPAMIENFPQSVDEQTKLGAFYLERNDTKNALEHFWLSAEMKPEDKQIKTNLGAIYFKMGDKNKAFEIWNEVLKSEELSVSEISEYFQTLQKNGLADKARETSFKVVIRKLEAFDYSSNDTEEEMRRLIRVISASFEEKEAKFDYFKKLCDILDQSLLLPEMIIDESLVERENLTPFYEMLIARNAKNKNYESDYEFESALQKSWNLEDAEEILEQENKFEIKESANEKLVWQKKYLDYLLEQNQILEAGTLVSQIEDELSRRFARPVWLRVAKLRLQILKGGTAQTFGSAKRLVGIEIKTNVANINPPDIARLNEVINLFRDEKRDTEARDLLEAFYARMLALEQFETANFTGLSRISFEKGDVERGLKILQTMNDLADEERRETALAEIANWEIVKTHAIETVKTAEIGKANDVEKQTSLRLSAEIADEFDQIDAAISFRQTLLEIALKDTNNKIELAKLFAKKDSENESVKLLADIINDRNSLRNARWQAIWAAREIVKNKQNLLNEITNADGEIKNAIEIMANNSIEIKVENPGSQFWFFIGLTAKSFRQNSLAINAFEQCLVVEEGAKTEKLFAAKSALQQLIEIYVAENQPNVALKLAETDQTAKSDELLDLLSKTAENIGEFQKAIKFEKAKKAENISDERVKNLETSAQQNNRKATNFTVDAEKTRKL
jgi:cellulose synthase operon protein C